MPFIYVLRSLTTDRSYTGATSNLEVRVVQHNSGQSSSTKPYRPWILVYQEEFETMAEALRRERVLKSGKGRDELRMLLEPESVAPSRR